MSQDIELFSGVNDVSFEDFLFQFRIIAAINKWKEKDLALLLGAYLQGPALTFFKYIYVEGIEYKTLCDKLRAEFPDNTNYVEKFYNARQEAKEDLLSFYYRLCGLQSKANIADDDIFVKVYLKGLIFKYKAALGSQLFASKYELRDTLFQMRDLFGEVQRNVINLPVIPPMIDDRKYSMKYERSTPCTPNNTQLISSMTKEVQPSKDMEMREKETEQHEKELHVEQHAEQPVELLAIGSEVEYKSGETGPFINVLIAQQEFRVLVDTGASISCVSEEFATKLDIQYIKESTKNSATTVSGANLTILGEASLNLLIDSCFFKQKFLVIKNIQQNIILGRDFLSKNDCLIDFSNNYLILKRSFVSKFIDIDTLRKKVSVSILTDKDHHSDANNDKTTDDIDDKLNKNNYIYFQNKLKVNNIRRKVLRKRRKRMVLKSSQTSTSSKVINNKKFVDSCYCYRKNVKKNNEYHHFYPSEGRIDTQYKKLIQLRNIDDNLVFLNRQNVDKYKDRKHFR